MSVLNPLVTLCSLLFTSIPSLLSLNAILKHSLVDWRNANSWSITFSRYSMKLLKPVADSSFFCSTTSSLYRRIILQFFRSRRPVTKPKNAESVSLGSLRSRSSKQITKSLTDRSKMICASCSVPLIDFRKGIPEKSKFSSPCLAYFLINRKCFLSPGKIGTILPNSVDFMS